MSGLRKIGIVLAAALGSFCLVGGNLFLLQLAAWGWMITSYSSEDGFLSAVTDTFSGERPCLLCTAISETQKDKGSNPQPSILAEKDPLKLLNRTERRLSLVAPARNYSWLVESDYIVCSPRPNPEDPPPRA